MFPRVRYLLLAGKFIQVKTIAYVRIWVVGCVNAKLGIRIQNMLTRRELSYLSVRDELLDVAVGTPSTFEDVP